ncbi:MAPEG family protein [Sphingomonas montanisoli]|uniref:MAPEG family protein n=1 Tax=Sphingomonas montanisoli TaxID=2606412 RepID=A0A5D9CD26_9SPHN|nr:MAPEG family protein [Sphingomonas montanisoli]TZG28930.1 MAPEG family protein [Sphingomonas montanisoli]
MIILPVTLTIAGAAAIVNLWLAIRVSGPRVKTKVSIGHGNVPLLEARMRAHSNFVEYTPFVLILMGLIELARGTSTVLWVIGIVYIVGRLLHGISLDKAGTNAFRGIGILITFVVLLALAGWAVSIPYVTKDGTITTVTSDSAH